jgi:diphthamide biosynthesis protein 7
MPNKTVTANKAEKNKITFEVHSNPDCISFCKHPQYKDLFLISYYEQEGTEQQWTGGFDLFSLGKSPETHTDANSPNWDGPAVTPSLLCDKTNNAGIFDIKWFNWPASFNEGSMQVASAQVDKKLNIFGIPTELIDGQYSALARMNLNDSVQENLVELQEKVLYIDIPEAGSQNIVTALDNGLVSLVDPVKLAPVSTYEVHEFSVWCCLYDTEGSGLVFSGADDAKLCAFDVKGNTKVFGKKVGLDDSGICHIIKNESDFGGNQIFVGSFDEHLRVYDKRSMQKPVHEEKLDGGIWRMSQIRDAGSDIDFLGCGLSYSNTFDVFTQSPTAEDKISMAKHWSSPETHKSLAYGLDWYSGVLPSPTNGKNGSILACCSFYDKLISLNYIF